MTLAILFLAAAAAFFSSPAHAAAGAIETAQEALTLDMYACARPAYPATALALGVGGTVTLELQVGEDGRAGATRITSSSGMPDIDAAALAALRRCTFHVVRALGVVRPGWLKTTFAWRSGGARPVPDGDTLAATRARAEAGEADAQNRLGAWHEHGSGVDKDPAQAAAWYRRAADNGHAVAQNNLGVLYHRGLGVAGDRRQAMRWYAKAAAQGHGWAQANLAWGYQHGSTGKKEMDLALHWLTKSAEGGLVPARLRLGLLLLARAASDDERAVAAGWLALAASRDAPAGHYYLGRTVELGLGSEQDDARAASLYRKALGRSNGYAETALGALIDSGRVPAETAEEAVGLYDKAMGARHGAAFYRYGLLLEARGDNALAQALFQHGAQLGHCEAGMRLEMFRRAQPGGEAMQYRFPANITMCKVPLETEPAF